LILGRELETSDGAKFITAPSFDWFKGLDFWIFPFFWISARIRYWVGDWDQTRNSWRIGHPALRAWHLPKRGPMRFLFKPSHQEFSLVLP
jgi:hypothetical protein